MSLIKCSECGQQISDKADKCPNCGAKPKKKTSVFTWMILVVIILTVYNVATTETSTDAAKSAGATSSKMTTKETVSTLLNLEVTNWTNNYGIMKASYLVTNSSDYDVKDITIKCSHFAKSGSKIDSNEREIFDIFKANSSKAINDFNMGFINSQAEKTSCSIVKFKLTSED